MKEKKKRDWKSIIGITVLISFIAPIAFIIYKIIVSPTTNVEQIEGVRVKTDYILMLTQCVLGVIAFFLPNMLSKKLKIVIPTNMYIVYVLFLWGAVFLGEVRNFYYRVPHWDTILHTCSGAMLGALGFSFINSKSIYGNISTKNSPPAAQKIMFMSLLLNISFTSFALSFAVALLPFSDFKRFSDKINLYPNFSNVFLAFKDLFILSAQSAPADGAGTPMQSFSLIKLGYIKLFTFL